MILNNHYTCILRLEELFLIHALFYISLNSVFKSSKFSSDVFKLFFFSLPAYQTFVYIVL